LIYRSDLYTNFEKYSFHQTTAFPVERETTSSTTNTIKTTYEMDN